MGLIHLIGGEKGGVGKSFFSMSLLHFLSISSVPYVLVDADPNNPDVVAIYDGIKGINFKVEDDETALMSRSMAEVDRIYDLAKDQLVVVNLPANVQKPLTYWIELNGLLHPTLIQKTGVSLVHWFLSNGSYNSVSLFLESVNHFNGQLRHVFVRNYGLCTDWSGLEKRAEFKEAADKYKFPDLVFPGLKAMERDYLEANRIPFAQSLKDSLMPVLSQQRLIKFLRQTMENIVLSELFDQYVNVDDFLGAESQKNSA